MGHACCRGCLGSLMYAHVCSRMLTYAHVCRRAGRDCCCGGLGRHYGCRVRAGVCMYVCMYVYMYVCIYVCMYVCMYVYIYVLYNIFIMHNIYALLLPRALNVYNIYRRNIFLQPSLPPLLLFRETPL